jgi:hypothetical protein
MDRGFESTQHQGGNLGRYCTSLLDRLLTFHPVFMPADSSLRATNNRGNFF